MFRTVFGIRKEPKQQAKKKTPPQAIIIFFYHYISQSKVKRELVFLHRLLVTNHDQLQHTAEIVRGLGSQAQPPDSAEWIWAMLPTNPLGHTVLCTDGNFYSLHFLRVNSKPDSLISELVKRIGYRLKQ